MAAVVIAAVAAPQVVTRGEHDVRPLAVKIFALDERRVFAQAFLSLALKAEGRACPAVDAGRAKTVLEVVLIEEVLDLAEEAKRA